LRARLDHAPGVRAASVAWVLPLSERGYGQSTYGVDGKTIAAGGTAPVTDFTEVGPRFFETLGVPILVGRPLTEADRVGAPAVVVVSQAFARRAFQDASPI